MIQGVAPAFNLIDRIDQDVLCNTKTGQRPVDTASLTKTASPLSKRSIFNNQQINIRGLKRDISPFIQSAATHNSPSTTYSTPTPIAATLHSATARQ